jgi:hypothetical protein
MAQDFEGKNKELWSNFDRKYRFIMIHEVFPHGDGDKGGSIKQGLRTAFAIEFTPPDK